MISSFWNCYMNDHFLFNDCPRRPRMRMSGGAVTAGCTCWVASREPTRRLPHFYDQDREAQK